MQNTGQGSEKRSYRVILLLIVGLAAFSSAMKELNHVHELTLQTGQLIAQWTDAMQPAEKNEMLVKLETCDTQIPVPAMPRVPPMPPVPPVPSVPHVPAEIVPAEPDDDVVPAIPAEVVVPAPLPPAPPRVREVPAIKSRRVVRVDRHAAASAEAAEAAEIRVLLSTEGLIEKSLKDALEADLSMKAPKAKNRRHILIGPEGRDVILKSLNRTVNLRSAS
jgi:hypothetical protein